MNIICKIIKDKFDFKHSSFRRKEKSPQVARQSIINFCRVSRGDFSFVEMTKALNFQGFLLEFDPVPKFRDRDKKLEFKNLIDYSISLFPL